MGAWRRLAAAVPLLMTAVAGASAGLLAWEHAARLAGHIWDVTDAVLVAAGVIGAIAAARFAAALTVALAAELRGAPAPRWSGTAATTVAAGLAAALLGTAAHAQPASDVDAPSAGWLPRADVVMMPVAPPAAAVPAPPDGSTLSADAVDRGLGRPDGTREERDRTRRVATGDSLWSLTADLLGPGASAAATARAWPALYAANHAVIGDDPDLIRPGMVLEIPAALAGGHP